MSSEVKRFWADLCVHHVEVVLYSDYAALEAELATVKKVAYGNMELLDENRNLQAELARLRAGQEPVAVVKESQYLLGDTSDEISELLPIGTKLYTTPQPSAGAVMPESVGVLILGGLFHGGSGPELGDIDIEPNMRVLERIQMELVTSSDDVHLELFARLNGKEVGRE